jgi:hypothetical protein
MRVPQHAGPLRRCAQANVHGRASHLRRSERRKLKSERRKWRPVARPQPQGPGPSLRLVQLECDLNDRPGPGGRGCSPHRHGASEPGRAGPVKQGRKTVTKEDSDAQESGPQQPGAPGLSSTRVTGPRAARGRPDCRLGVQGCRRSWPRTGPRRTSDAAAVPAMADRCHARLLRMEGRDFKKVQTRNKASFKLEQGE